MSLMLWEHVQRLVFQVWDSHPDIGPWRSGLVLKCERACRLSRSESDCSVEAACDDVGPVSSAMMACATGFKEYPCAMSDGRYAVVSHRRARPVAVNTETRG